MSEYFNYKTSSKLSTVDKQKILQEVAQLQRTRTWWVEPIFFSVVPMSGKPTADDLFDLFRKTPTKEQYSLSGRTKIFLVAYSGPGGDLVNVDADEDALMTFRDLKFITEQLCEWSRLYGLDWELSCSEPIGHISGGMCDVNLTRFLLDLLNSTALEDDDGLAQTISEKYSSRNEW